MSVINTNILSLTTQNNLKTSQLSLNSAIQRLSSGMRINSAKDDAAGQAIANRFTANIRGLTQAQRNANDGISLAQTTEGALGEINANLQRIRELAVQAVNGSNSDDDKVSIQAEIKQRLDEIDRTSAQTDFNGVKVLSSTARALDVQVGAKDGETITIELEEISSQTLSLQGFNVTGPVGTVDNALGAADLTEMYGVGNALTSATVTDSNADLKADLGLLNAGTTVSYAAARDANGSLFAEITIAVGDATDAATLVGEGFADAVSGGSIKRYVALDPKDVTVAGAVGQFTIDTAAIAVADLAEAAGSTANPLAAVDDALKQVDDLRGKLGAVQNRFDSVISNLGTTINNLKSSRSRIEDADYATEVSNMSRAQILQQAGTSVLAQANQTTQGVLSLLR